MNNDGFIIDIKDENEEKCDIVYNNVVSSMNNMSMSKDEQIEYLKSRISELERSKQKRFNFLILCMFAGIFNLIGITFVVLNLYFVGAFIIFSTCFISCFHTYKLSSNIKKSDSIKFDKIESIRKFISSRVK